MGQRQRPAPPRRRLDRRAARRRRLGGVRPPARRRAGRPSRPSCPRRSAFRRKQAGHETAEQVVAANVDVLFLVTSLNQDLNVRRIERYMTLAWESGADPVVVLTKADLCPDIEPALALVETVTFGVPVHVTSALTGAGFDDVRAHLDGGRTGAAVGSSGRRQVDPDQRALRRGAARDPRDPRRRPRPAHHHPPRADRPPGYRLRHRHARHARAPALGLGRGARAGVRGRRRGDRRVPVLGLRPRHRAGLRRAGGDRGRQPRRRALPELPRSSSASFTISRSATTPAPGPRSASAGGPSTRRPRPGRGPSS